MPYYALYQLNECFFGHPGVGGLLVVERDQVVRRGGEEVLCGRAVVEFELKREGDAGELRKGRQRRLELDIAGAHRCSWCRWAEGAWLAAAKCSRESVQPP